MDNSYRQKCPADVFFSWPHITKTPFSEGNKPLFGNRPTSNDFIDLFARLICQYGHRPVIFYANQMGVKPDNLATSIITMSGIGAHQWITEYLLFAGCELLAKTDWSITEIGHYLGFTSVSTFSQFFLRAKKCQAYEWRWLQKTGKKISYHYIRD